MVQQSGKQMHETGQSRADMAHSAYSHMLRSGHENPMVREGDRFFEAGYKAAVQAGCEFLFEVPPVLLEKNADRAAAIRCDRDGESELFFLVFDARRASMTILEEDKVPASVLDFTLSYAGVLSLIAAGKNGATPKVH